MLLCASPIPCTCIICGISFYLSSHRFLTYHCLLYNETSWCQPSGQFPLKQTTNIQTQVQSLTHKIDSTATADGIHSQSLTKAITQQAKAEATSDEDKSNGNLIHQ